MIRNDAPIKWSMRLIRKAPSRDSQHDRQHQRISTTHFSIDIEHLQHSHGLIGTATHH